MARAQGIKKSNFPAKTTVADDSTFDYVEIGTNIKITKKNLLAALGVTGTIVQVGNVLGTPVLDTQGSVNRVRNLENGPGVKASVSPENGAKLEHNFLVDTVGAQLLLNATALQPKFPSLLAGSGIALSAVGDQIVIGTSGVPVGVKTVVINQTSDFPTAVGGVITLAADTDYLLTNDITVSDRFVMSDNSQVRGASSVVINLTYTGTGAMFTSENNNLRYRNITFTAATGSFFDITSSTDAGIGIIIAQGCEFSGATMGNVHARIFTISESIVLLTAGGLTSTGVSMTVLIVSASSWIQTTGTAIDLGSTIFETVQTSNLFVTLSSGVTFLSGLTDSDNLVPNGEGIVSAVRFTGSGFTTLSDINPDDDRWEFFGNNLIRDTIRDGIVSMQGNSTETIIASSGVPVLVAGTFTVGRNSGFTPDTGGKITYDLGRDIVVPISVSLSVQMASGGSVDVSACVAKNGTVITSSSIGTQVSSSDKDNITLTWQEELIKNDSIEVFVQNDTNMVNIIVIDMVLRVQ